MRSLAQKLHVNFPGNPWQLHVRIFMDRVETFKGLYRLNVALIAVFVTDWCCSFSCTRGSCSRSCPCCSRASWSKLKLSGVSHVLLGVTTVLNNKLEIWNLFFFFLLPCSPMKSSFQLHQFSSHCLKTPWLIFLFRRNGICSTFTFSATRTCEWFETNSGMLRMHHYHPVSLSCDRTAVKNGGWLLHSVLVGNIKTWLDCGFVTLGRRKKILSTKKQWVEHWVNVWGVRTRHCMESITYRWKKHLLIAVLRKFLI